MCHQTVSLAARHLEENDIATVVMGCAKDIVEFVGVPRFLFSVSRWATLRDVRKTRNPRPSPWNWP